MASPLTVEQLTKQYGGSTPVLDDLTWTADPGTLTLLVGPNGAGKTTLLRLLSVQTFPTSGSVSYGSLSIHDEPYRYLEKVGIVHAGPQLPEHLTAVELLEWILRSRDHWDEEASARLHRLLDRLRLHDQRTDLIGTYSSGMVQKTQVAAALVAEPEVLLMDEPLRSLDTATTDAVVELVREFVDQGGLAVVASHLTDSFTPFADDVRELGSGASSKPAVQAPTSSRSSA